MAKVEEPEAPEPVMPFLLEKVKHDQIPVELKPGQELMINGLDREDEVDPETGESLAEPVVISYDVQDGERIVTRETTIHPSPGNPLKKLRINPQIVGPVRFRKHVPPVIPDLTPIEVVPPE